MEKKYEDFEENSDNCSPVMTDEHFEDVVLDGTFTFDDADSGAGIKDDNVAYLDSNMVNIYHILYRANLDVDKNIKLFEGKYI